MLNKTYCVYKHTNKENGKVYIGITCQSPNERWQYGMGYKDNTSFFQDIILFGWNNFTHEILHNDLDEQTALNIENKLIIQCQSYLPEKGYNHKVSLKYPGDNIAILERDKAQFTIPYEWYKLAVIINNMFVESNKKITNTLGEINDDVWFDQIHIAIMSIVDYYVGQKKPCTITNLEFQNLFHTSHYTIEKAMRLLCFIGIINKEVSYTESGGLGHLRKLTLNYQCIKDILNGTHWIFN